MKRTGESANSTVTFKVSAPDHAALKLLAKYERLTVSAFCRGAVADRVGFERSIGSPALKETPGEGQPSQSAEPPTKKQDGTTTPGE